MIVAPDNDRVSVEWPPRWLGTIVAPDDPQSEASPPQDDPVARAEARRFNAGRAFDLVSVTSETTRALDELATAIDGEDDWRYGISRFDRGVAELRRKHGEAFRDATDRAAFDDHLDRFAALRRMDLRQGLVDSQHTAAFGKLDETLAYYAERAARAKYPIERDMFSDAGIEAIERLRDAGYMGPQLAGLFHEDFRKQIEELGRPTPIQITPDQSPQTADTTQSDAEHTAVADIDQLEHLLTPLAEQHEDLRPQLAALRVASNDPSALVQLAQSLLGIADIESSTSRNPRSAIIQRALEWLKGQLRARRRQQDEKPPQQLPRPENEEPGVPQGPAPQPVLRPRAPDMQVPPSHEDSTDTGKQSRPRYEPTKPIATGEARYKTIGNRRFVQYEDGSSDFGEITPEIGEIIGAEAAPIKLPEGRTETTGERHLERKGKAKEIRDAGYASGADLVDDVGHNFDEIWRGRGDTLLLVKRANGPRSPMVYVELNKSPSSRSYEVKTGGNWGNDYPSEKGRVLLWRGERTSSTATGEQEPYATSTLNEPGSGDRNASVQNSTTNIGTPGASDNSPHSGYRRDKK